MSRLTTERLSTLLEEYVRQTGVSVDLLLVDGLALQAYGYADRATQDVDGEVKAALMASPKDAALFLFRKTVEILCARLIGQPRDSS